MSPAKAGRASSTPATPGSSERKSSPAPKANQEHSATSLEGSGDSGSSAARPQPAYANAWGPGGRGSPPGHQKRRARTQPGARENDPSPRPAAAQERGARRPRAARAPKPTRPRKEQPAPSPPRPEEVPLGAGVKMDGHAVEAVEQQTSGQRENPRWFSWRQNRITASMAHQVSHSRFVNGRSDTPPASYLTAITGGKLSMKTRAMTWGIEQEATAAREYQRLKSKSRGRPVRVQECGLFIDPERSWLAASPDGIVEDAESGERLLCLEIKCPYKHRQRTVAEACEGDRDFCLELQSNAGEGEPRYRLKTKHCYYTQVQCQMAVVGLHQADFVVFTLRETAVVPVTFDPEFWDSTVAKMEMFYTDAVLPYLQRRELGVPLQRREE